MAIQAGAALLLPSPGVTTPLLLWESPPGQLWVPGGRAWSSQGHIPVLCQGTSLLPSQVAPDVLAPASDGHPATATS